MTPLTPEQKTHVKAVTDSASSAQSAASQGRGLGVRTTTAGVSEKSRELGDVLRGPCKFENTLPERAVTGEFHVNVSGEACPIRMTSNYRVIMVRKGGFVSNRFDIQMSYLVRTPEFARLNDVVGIEMNGSMKGEGSDNGGSGGGRIDGAFQSQIHGRLPFSISLSASGNQSGWRSTAVYTLRFPNFACSGKIVEESTRAKGTQTYYYLNDQQVSEQEFNATFNRDVLVN